MFLYVLYLKIISCNIRQKCAYGKSNEYLTLPY